MADPRDEFESLTPADSRTQAPGRAARVGERVLDLDIELRPRGVGATLDLGLDLIKSRFASCFILATILWLPMRFLTSLLRPIVEGGVATNPDDLLLSFSAMSLTYVLAWIAQMLVSVFTARLLFDTASGGEATIGSTLLIVLRRFPGLLLLSMIHGFLLIASFVLCFLPVFGMTWALTPLTWIYVIEDVTVTQALRRSFTLSFDRLFSWPSFYSFWRWAGIVYVASLLLGPLSGLAAVADVPEVRNWFLEIFPMSSTAFEVWSVLLGSVFLGATTAIQSSIITAYYLDCRVRRDGLDLAAWLRRLRQGSARPDGAQGGDVRGVNA
ncbi:MAG: hypothetical protein JNL28_08950 [Planctomycetes bacterium]|nr:hypothetical protein [Planctomycetota bacterium]